jgi:hypothetical protein
VHTHTTLAKSSHPSKTQRTSSLGARVGEKIFKKVEQKSNTISYSFSHAREKERRTY